MFRFGKKPVIKVTEKKEAPIAMANAAEIKKELDRSAKNLKGLIDALTNERAKNVGLTADLEKANARVKELEGQSTTVKSGVDSLAETNAAAEAAISGS